MIKQIFFLLIVFGNFTISSMQKNQSQVAMQAIQLVFPDETGKEYVFNLEVPRDWNETQIQQSIEHPSFMRMIQEELRTQKLEQEEKYKKNNIQSLNDLLKAIDSNDVQLAKKALAHNINLNPKSGFITDENVPVIKMKAGLIVTPLFLACLRGREKIVSLLLKHNANPNYILVVRPFEENDERIQIIKNMSKKQQNIMWNFVKKLNYTNEQGQVVIFFPGFTAFHGACMNPMSIQGINESVPEEVKLRIIKLLHEAEQKRQNDGLDKKTISGHTTTISYDPFGEFAYSIPKLPSELAKESGYHTIAEYMQKIEQS